MTVDRRKCTTTVGPLRWPSRLARCDGRVGWLRVGRVGWPVAMAESVGFALAESVGFALAESVGFALASLWLRRYNTPNFTRSFFFSAVAAEWRTTQSGSGSWFD
jgi:hypothetical protein